jgi:hypothetical protein
LEYDEFDNKDERIVQRFRGKRHLYRRPYLCEQAGYKYCRQSDGGVAPPFLGTPKPKRDSSQARGNKRKREPAPNNFNCKKGRVVQREVPRE